MQVDLRNEQGVTIAPPVPSAPHFGSPAASSSALLFLPGSGSDSPVIILGKSHRETR